MGKEDVHIIFVLWSALMQSVLDYFIRIHSLLNAFLSRFYFMLVLTTVCRLDGCMATQPRKKTVGKEDVVFETLSMQYFCKSLIACSGFRREIRS